MINENLNNEFLTNFVSNKKLSLKFLTTCLPNYFSGYSGYVYSIPVNYKDDYKTVFENLMIQIKNEELCFSNEFIILSQHYEELETCCSNMMLDIISEGLQHEVFNKFIEKPDENKFTDYETVYAYFGVIVEDV